MESSTLQKCSRFSLCIISVLIGTELIYRLMNKVWSLLRPIATDEKIYRKVIFFPDEGILSSMKRDQVGYSKSSNTDDACTKESLVLDRSLEDARKFPTNSLFTSDLLPRQKEWRDSSGTHQKTHPLYNSTSLVPMIRVLDSSKKSLVVCVYLITSDDLLEAIVRAKKRGVRVRVILDKNMSSTSNTSSLLDNRIQIRYSKASQMMHHKFAVIDAPYFEMEQNVEKSSIQEVAKCGNVGSNFERRSVFSKSEANIDLSKGGVLMTGSFNWTWSGVVSNFENVVVTNDHNLVGAYAAEFEKLWKSFGYTVPTNS